MDSVLRREHCLPHTNTNTNAPGECNSDADSNTHPDTSGECNSNTDGDPSRERNPEPDTTDSNAHPKSRRASP